jgi:hypothetical protein
MAPIKIGAREVAKGKRALPARAESTHIPPRRSTGTDAQLGVRRSNAIGGAKPPAQGRHMKHINFAMTIEELRLLASLASDQLFRRRFIDPKMPGYKGSREDLEVGQAIVARMQSLLGEARTAAGVLMPSPAAKEPRIV